MRGVVKFWSDEKGWGFVTPDDGSKAVFVHHTGLGSEFADDSGRKGLIDGQPVEYDLEETPKGPKAVEVRRPAGQLA